jgi:hypothetical protein
VLAIAARFRREAKALRAEAVKRERAADVLEAKLAETVDEVEAARAGLTMRPKRSRLGSTMQAATDQPRNVRIAAGHAARAKRAAPSEARRLLLAAGQTPSMVAKALKVGRSTVQAWLDGTRGISEPHVEAASKRWGIPRSAWPRIA